jgi:hypothetical protein
MRRYSVSIPPAAGRKIRIAADEARNYKDAVYLFGNPDLYRFYIIAHAGQVDEHADGGDLGASSAEEDVDPTVQDKLTPMQAYTQRTFAYLVDWVENGVQPPDSKLVETDPANDITDPNDLDW